MCIALRTAPVASSSEGMYRPSIWARQKLVSPDSTYKHWPQNPMDAKDLPLFWRIPLLNALIILEGAQVHPCEPSPILVNPQNVEGCSYSRLESRKLQVLQDINSSNTQGSLFSCLENHPIRGKIL